MLLLTHFISLNIPLLSPTPLIQIVKTSLVIRPKSSKVIVHVLNTDYRLQSTGYGENSRCNKWVAQLVNKVGYQVYVAQTLVRIYWGSTINKSHWKSTVIHIFRTDQWQRFEAQYWLSAKLKIQLCNSIPRRSIPFQYFHMRGDNKPLTRTAVIE